MPGDDGRPGGRVASLSQVQQGTCTESPEPRTRGICNRGSSSPCPPLILGWPCFSTAAASHMPATQTTQTTQTTHPARGRPAQWIVPPQTAPAGCVGVGAGAGATRDRTGGSRGTACGRWRWSEAGSACQSAARGWGHRGRSTCKRGNAPFSPPKTRTLRTRARMRTHAHTKGPASPPPSHAVPPPHPLEQPPHAPPPAAHVEVPDVDDGRRLCLAERAAGRQQVQEDGGDGAVHVEHQVGRLLQRVGLRGHGVVEVAGGGEVLRAGGRAGGGAGGEGEGKGGCVWQVGGW